MVKMVIFQQSRFLALVSDYDRLSELYDEAANSQDASLVQTLKTMDSLETKIQNVKNAFQGFYANLGLESVFKGVLDVVTNVVNRLNSMPKLFGKIPVAAIGMAANIINVIKTLGTTLITVAAAQWGQIRKIIETSITQGTAEGVEKSKQKMNELTPAQSKQNKTWIGGQVASLIGAGISTLGLTMKDNQAPLRGLTQTVGGLTSGFGSFLTTVALIPTPMGKVLGLLSGLASALPGIISGINDLTHAEQLNISSLKEQAEQSEQSALMARQEANDLGNTIEKIEKLSKAKYDSNEAYQEWLDYVNQVASQYPQLISMYDAEGNAVLDMAAAYQMLAQARAKAAEAKLQQQTDDLNVLIAQANQVDKVLQSNQNNFSGEDRSKKGLGLSNANLSFSNVRFSNSSYDFDINDELAKLFFENTRGEEIVLDNLNSNLKINLESLAQIQELTVDQLEELGYDGADEQLVHSVQQAYGNFLYSSVIKPLSNTDYLSDFGITSETISKELEEIKSLYGDDNFKIEQATYEYYTRLAQIIMNISQQGKDAALQIQALEKQQAEYENSFSGLIDERTVASNTNLDEIIKLSKIGGDKFLSQLFATQMQATGLTVEDLDYKDKANEVLDALIDWYSNIGEETYNNFTEILSHPEQYTSKINFKNAIEKIGIELPEEIDSYINKIWGSTNKDLQNSFRQNIKNSAINKNETIQEAAKNLLLVGNGVKTDKNGPEIAAQYLNNINKQWADLVTNQKNEAIATQNAEFLVDTYLNVGQLSEEVNSAMASILTSADLSTREGIQSAIDQIESYQATADLSEADASKIETVLDELRTHKENLLLNLNTEIQSYVDSLSDAVKNVNTNYSKNTSGFDELKDANEILQKINSYKSKTGEEQLDFNKVFKLDETLGRYTFTLKGLQEANNQEMANLSDQYSGVTDQLEQSKRVLETISGGGQLSQEEKGLKNQIKILSQHHNYSEEQQAYLNDLALRWKDDQRTWDEFIAAEQTNLEQLGINIDQAYNAAQKMTKEAQQRNAIKSFNFSEVAKSAKTFGEVKQTIINYLTTGLGYYFSSDELAEEWAKNWYDSIKGGGLTAAEIYRQNTPEDLFDPEVYNEILNQPVEASKSLLDKLNNSVGQTSIQLNKSEIELANKLGIENDGVSVSVEELREHAGDLFTILQEAVANSSVSLADANKEIFENKLNDELTLEKQTSALTSLMTSDDLNISNLENFATALGATAKFADNFNVEDLKGIKELDDGRKIIDPARIQEFVNSFNELVLGNALNEDEVSSIISSLNLQNKSKITDAAVQAENSIIESIATEINNIKSAGIDKKVNLTYLQNKLGDNSLTKIFGSAYQDGMLTVTETVKVNMYTSLQTLRSELKANNYDTSELDKTLIEYVNSSISEISEFTGAMTVSDNTAQVLASQSAIFKGELLRNGKITLKTAESFARAANTVYTATTEQYQKGLANLTQLNSSYANIIKSNLAKQTAGFNMLTSASKIDLSSLQNFLNVYNKKLSDYVDRMGRLTTAGANAGLQSLGNGNYQIADWHKFISQLQITANELSTEYIDAYVSWLQSDANVAPNAKEALITSLIPNMEKLTYAQIGQIAKTFNMTVDAVLALVENNGDNTFNANALINSLDFDRNNREFSQAFINQKKTVTSNMTSAMISYIEAGADGDWRHAFGPLQQAMHDFEEGLQALGISASLDVNTLARVLRSGGEQAVIAAQEIASLSGQELSASDIETLYRGQVGKLVNAIDTVIAKPGEIVDKTTADLISQSGGQASQLGTTGQYVVESAANLYEAYNNLLQKMAQTGEATLADLNKVQALALENRLNENGTNEQQVIDALGDAAGMTFTRFGEILADAGIRLTEQMVNDLETAGIIDLMGGNKMKIIDFQAFADLMHWDANSEEYVSAFKSYNDSLIEMNRQAERNILEEAQNVASAKGGDWVNLTQFMDTIYKSIIPEDYNGNVSNLRDRAIVDFGDYYETILGTSFTDADFKEGDVGAQVGITLASITKTGIELSEETVENYAASLLSKAQEMKDKGDDRQLSEIIKELDAASSNLLLDAIDVDSVKDLSKALNEHAADLHNRQAAWYDLQQALPMLGGRIEDGILKLDESANIPAIMQMIQQSAENSGSMLSSELAELADAVADAIKGYADLINGAISGSLSNVQAEQLQDWADSVGIGKLDFTETQDGLKVATNQAFELVDALKQVDSMQGKLTFDNLVDSLSADKGGKFENISKTTAEIAKAQRQIKENQEEIVAIRKNSEGDIEADKRKISRLVEQNKQLKEQIGLYREIRQRQSIDPSQYNFMDRDLPEVFQGPINYWNSVGKAFEAMNESGSTGKMAINDFYNIVNEMENLANISGTAFQLAGYQIGGEASQAADLIQKGLGSLTNIDGKGVKVDLSKLGIDFVSGADNAKQNFADGVNKLAESQIAMLDAAIKVLEIVVAMENLGDISVDDNPEFSFGDVFDLGTPPNIDAEGNEWYNFTEEFNTWRENIVSMLTEGSDNYNADLAAAAESIKINGVSLKEMLEAGADEIKDLGITQQEYFDILKAFQTAAASGDYDLDNIQESVWEVLKNSGLTSDMQIDVGDYTLTVTGDTKALINWKEPNTQEAVAMAQNKYGEDEEAAKKRLKEAFRKFEQGEKGDLIETLLVLHAKNEIELVFDKDGNPKIKSGDKEIDPASVEGQEIIAKAALEAKGIDEKDLFGESLTYDAKGNPVITVRGKTKIGEAEVIVEADGEGNVVYTDTKYGYTASTLEELENKMVERWITDNSSDENGKPTSYQARQALFGVNVKPKVEVKTDLDTPQLKQQAASVAKMSTDKLKDLIEEENNNYEILEPTKEGYVRFNLGGIEVEVEDTGDLEKNLAAAQEQVAKLVEGIDLIGNISEAITNAFTKDDGKDGNAIQNAITTAIQTALGIDQQQGEDGAGIPISGITLAPQGLTINLDQVGEPTISGADESSEIPIPEVTLVPENVVLQLEGTEPTAEEGGKQQEIEGGTTNLKPSTITVDTSSFNAEPVAQAIADAIQSALDGHKITPTIEAPGATGGSNPSPGSKSSSSGTVDTSGVDNLTKATENLNNNSSGAAQQIEKISEASTKADATAFTEASEATTGAKSTALVEASGATTSADASDMQKASSAINDADPNNAQIATSYIKNIDPSGAQGARNAINAISPSNAQIAASYIKNIDPSGAQGARNAINAIKAPTSLSSKLSVTLSSAKGNMPGAAKSKGSNLALANGRTKTLMGELGPELVVSNGHYFMVGQNGAEFVDLADDAIVFNHLQTRRLMEQGAIGGRGKPFINERKAVAFAKGKYPSFGDARSAPGAGLLGDQDTKSDPEPQKVKSVSLYPTDFYMDLLKGKNYATGGKSTKSFAKGTGPAMGAGASAALAALKQLKAMWESLLHASLADMGGMPRGSGGGGGGGGGGNNETEKAVAGINAEVERWYNWLKLIEATQNQINILTKKYDLLTSQGANTKTLAANLQEQAKLLQVQVATAKQLQREQTAYRTSVINKANKGLFSAFYQADPKTGQVYLANDDAFLKYIKNNQNLKKNKRNNILNTVTNDKGGQGETFKASYSSKELITIGKQAKQSLKSSIGKKGYNNLSDFEKRFYTPEGKLKTAKEIGQMLTKSQKKSGVTIYRKGGIKTGLDFMDELFGQIDKAGNNRHTAKEQLALIQAMGFYDDKLLTGVDTSQKDWEAQVVENFKEKIDTDKAAIESLNQSIQEQAEAELEYKKQIQEINNEYHEMAKPIEAVTDHLEEWYNWTRKIVVEQSKLNILSAQYTRLTTRRGDTTKKQLTNLTDQGTATKELLNDTETIIGEQQEKLDQQNKDLLNDTALKRWFETDENGNLVFKTKGTLTTSKAEKQFEVTDYQERIGKDKSYLRTVNYINTQGKEVEATISKSRRDETLENAIRQSYSRASGGQTISDEDLKKAMADSNTFLGLQDSYRNRNDIPNNFQKLYKKTKNGYVLQRQELVHQAQAIVSGYDDGSNILDPISINEKTDSNLGQKLKDLRASIKNPKEFFEKLTEKINNNPVFDGRQQMEILDQMGLGSQIAAFAQLPSWETATEAERIEAVKKYLEYVKETPEAYNELLDKLNENKEKAEEYRNKIIEINNQIKELLKPIDGVTEHLEYWYTQIQEIADAQNKLNKAQAEYNNLLKQQQLKYSNKAVSDIDLAEKLTEEGAQIKRQIDANSTKQTRIGRIIQNRTDQFNDIPNNTSWRNIFKIDENTGKMVYREKDVGSNKITGTAKIEVIDTDKNGNERKNINGKNKTYEQFLKDRKYYDEKTTEEEKEAIENEWDTYLYATTEKEFNLDEIFKDADLDKNGTIKLDEYFNALTEKDITTGKAKFSLQQQMAALDKGGFTDLIAQLYGEGKWDELNLQQREEATKQFLEMVPQYPAEYNSLIDEKATTEIEGLNLQGQLADVNLELQDLATISAGIKNPFEDWYNWIQKVTNAQNKLNLLNKQYNNLQKERVVNGNELAQNLRDQLTTYSNQLDIIKGTEIEQGYIEARQEKLNSLVGKNGKLYTNEVLSKFFTYDKEKGLQYNTTTNTTLGKLNTNGIKLTGEVDKNGVYKYDSTKDFQFSANNIEDFIEQLTKQNDDGSMAYNIAEQFAILREAGFTDYMLYDSSGNEIFVNGIENATQEQMQTAVSTVLNNLKGFQDEVTTETDAIQSLNEQAEDIEGQMIDIKNQIQDNEIELENRILQAIEDREQFRIDELKKQKDMLSDAADKFLDGLSKQLDKEKDMYERQEKQDELVKLQRQLAILQRSGGSSSQIRSLQDQIRSQQKDQYFDERQQQIDAIKEASDAEIERLDRQIQIAEETLTYAKENGLYWNEVREIMRGTSSQISTFLETNLAERRAQSSLQVQVSISDDGKIASLFTDFRDTPAFKQGGLIDYTGPAWVDGSKTEPESVLTADQTDFLRNQLIDNLQTFSLAINQFTQGTLSNNMLNSLNDSAGINIEQLDFVMKVDSIGNDYDARRAGQQAFEEMVRIARKSGNRSISRR